MSNLTQLYTGLLIAATTGSYAFSADIPIDDRELFAHLFTVKSIPEEWISPPANEELTPAMMEKIAVRLSKQGGKYEQATKSARGWVLDFQNGTARARILRATDNKLIGVFFSKLE